jgi:hypothetical protein
MKKRSRFIPPAVRRAVLERDGHACVDCGVKETLIPQGAVVMQTNLQLHHLQEFENGGSNDPDNLIAVCMPCHKKRDRDYVRLAMRNTLETHRAERRARGFLNIRETLNMLGLKYTYQLHKYFVDGSLTLLNDKPGYEKLISRKEVDALLKLRGRRAA